VTEKELFEQEQKWKQQKKLLKRQIKITKDKQRITNIINNKKQLTTTKLLIMFLFINFTIIEIFTGWITIRSLDMAMYSEYYTPDFTPLVTLIGAIVGEVMSFATYALKSVKENCAGGVVYDAAMRAYEEPQNDDGSVG